MIASRIRGSRLCSASDDPHWASPIRSCVRSGGYFFDYRDLMRELESVDACFFCLGVSSVGMSEAEYSRQTFDLTLAAGRALAAAHSGATFCYVSGQGTDSSERG